MGKLILKKNGIETQLITGIDFTTLTPQTDVYYVGVDSVTGTFDKLNPNGTIIDLEAGGGGLFTGGTVNGFTQFLNGVLANSLTATTISAATYLNLPSMGGGVIEVTYMQLTTLISSNGLTQGAYYLITDFQTIYDRPDYFINNSQTNRAGTLYGPNDPIIVLATSENTLAPDAYQPNYPNDKIKYDYSWSTTEINGNPAMGRISERIDEWNNRTDYDHRTIEFKRYQSYDLGNKLVGYIQDYDCTTGNVNGVNTLFLTQVSNGDVLLFDSENNFGYQVGVKVVSVNSDTNLTVVVDPLYNGTSFSFNNINYNKGLSTGNFYDYKEVYVGQSYQGDYAEQYTFQLNGYTLSNYIGDYSKFYIEGAYSNSGFLLANNTFGNNSYSNTIGDRSYNNATYNWFVRNSIEGRFYNNSIRRGVYGNTIGQYFYNNLIDGYMYDNAINDDFNGNKLYSNFNSNVIGNGFNNNVLYNEFYDNKIGVYFEQNTLGDSGNVDNWSFYRNVIGNNFNNNLVSQEFQNNQIGNQFQSNNIYGEFYKNEIGNGFNNNENIKTQFYGNKIGNGFNNNYYLGNNFNTNIIGDYFSDNQIGPEFRNNELATYFGNNRVGNFLTYGWNNLSNVTSRTYNTWRAALNYNVGEYIVGENLVMLDTVNNQYYKIRFTQWTQNANGGGFSYERTPIDTAGNNVGPTVYFTKNNYESITDVIVPGVLEITRGNAQGIYNAAVEGGYNSSAPANTQWNSIYSQTSENGIRFGYNKIGNNFNSNIIGNEFGYGGSYDQGNQIADDFQNNIVGLYMYNNVIGNFFQYNTIGDNFENNTIKNYFKNNQIGNEFESNIIGDYFGVNITSGVYNIIGNGFKSNVIGNFFGNNQNYPTENSGSSNDGGNVVGNNFQNNKIGDNTIFNLFGSDFTGNKIGDFIWFNAFADTTQDNTIGNYFYGNTSTNGFPDQIGGQFISNRLGNYVTYNQIDNIFSNNDIGDFFGNTSNPTRIYEYFYSNKIGNNFSFNGENTIYSQFYNNLIGDSFYLNEIGQNGGGYLFYYNVIGNDFNSNTIYTNFQNNKITNNFDNNICNGDFRKNNIDCFISGYDFSSATFVYTDYNCNLFENSSNVLRLSYYDGSDVLNITNITA